jgi:hypothetical protein
MTIRFEPPAYVESKRAVRAIQTNCLGYHAPETKRVCGECAVAAIVGAAQGERERCALFLEGKGYLGLADLLRELE